MQVHCSVNGRNFKSKMRAERLEILQSPWLIELGALYLNFNESNGGKSNELFSQFSCNLSDTEPIMTLMFPDSVKLEYDLTCPICLVRNSLDKTMIFVSFPWHDITHLFMISRIWSSIHTL